MKGYKRGTPFEVKKSRNKWVRAPKYAIPTVFKVNSTDMSRFIIFPMNPFILRLDITYKNSVEVIAAKIKECVIPLCEKTKRYGTKNPIHAMKMVSRSSEIPPNAPSSLFLLLIANKMIYGTRKCVKKSIICISL
ncbi:hypothetical protein DSECCO2_189580 [anaerobic digester metagenome]